MVNRVYEQKIRRHANKSQKHDVKFIDISLRTIIYTKQPKGLAQPVVRSVSGDLTSAVLAGTPFESLWARLTSLH